MILICISVIPNQAENLLMPLLVIYFFLCVNYIIIDFVHFSTGCRCCFYILDPGPLTNVVSRLSPSLWLISVLYDIFSKEKLRVLIK